MIIFIGRSLGYANNKENFTNLCQNINIELLKTKCMNLRTKNLIDTVYDYLLIVSGISEKQTGYDSADCEYSVKNKWNILKSRPANNYLYRIKNLSRFVSKLMFLSDEEFSNFLIEKISDFKKLQNFFSDSLNFSAEINHKIGRGHLNIILSNSVLPALHAYFSLINDVFSENKIFGIALNLKGVLVNSKIRTMIERMDLIPDIINSRFFYQLGLLYISDNFCPKYCRE